MEYCDRPGCVDEAVFTAEFTGSKGPLRVKLCGRCSQRVREMIADIRHTKEKAR